ncbi:hypothetical protein [Pedosphaera parvula]|uniref:Uncharacterized protein n=1 Tax=Pedosphaera parvula (strain Ellin514) TaxID=320771 RepID=B9XKT7_PEDPL|nr:hypothetical protein [Pedosphaera parvula]EEF59580.1 hypothetical protein Cflav_PD2487 [Pedosphaera parvula Ellin514]
MKTFTALLTLALAASANAQSTVAEDESYAWGTNLGWINFRADRPNLGDGVRVADTCLGGYVWSPNIGWINFGDGTPANNLRYANTDSSDYGVNQDGAGNLSGLAWSPNIGWINFGWANTANPNRPRFDLYSGEFSGYAWSANCGWINLGSGLLRTESIAITDSDGDGISDSWELEKAGNLTTLTAEGDADGDGLKDKAEYIMDSNPLVPNEGLRILSVAHNVATHLSLVEWTSRPTRTYALHQNTDLAANFWNDLGTRPGSSAASTTAQVFSYQPSAFYRIEAKLPLTP